MATCRRNLQAFSRFAQRLSAHSLRNRQAVHAAPSEGLLRGATLFDIYRPKPGGEAAAHMAAAEKSLAVRLVLASDQDTLTDERIDGVVKAVVERLQADLGARLRR